MTVIPPLTKVLLADAIEAKVLYVVINPGGVQYQVAWMNGNHRNTALVEECEVKEKPAPRVEVGFR